jgi:hypothetical protein
MGSREELKVFIDHLPEARLEPVRMMLEQVHPRPPRPELDRIRRRGEEYQRLVEQGFRNTGRPGTVGGFRGAGFGDVHDGVPIGIHGFHILGRRRPCQPDPAILLGPADRNYATLSISSDRTKLNCIVELSSGSHTVRHEDEFPLSEAQATSTDQKPWSMMIVARH